MMSFLSNLFSFSAVSRLNKYQPLIAKINSWEPYFSSLTDLALKEKTIEFKARLAAGSTEESILPEVFAAGREAAKRTLGQRHFDVQLLGGIVLHYGNIAEMKTGEGKTLVATLPAYLNALTGRGVHIITVNDYLSRRDAVWMGQIYNALGLSVGVLNHDSSFLYDPGHIDADPERDQKGGFTIIYDFLKPVSRKEAYRADITYGTNNEFGFDYLRDHLAYDKNNVVQREKKLGGHHFAIVDEVDSILIDESRTPLIISAPAAESENLYQTFAKIARQLEVNKHYTVDEKFKAVSLTDEGISKAEALLGSGDIYTDKGIKYVHHLETAVRAKALFQPDKHYVVKDREVIIVDEFTGRLQPGRRWSEGLHQAIEAKEGVTIKEESRTFATITYQNYFRLYKKLAGMTGTGLTSREEFLKVYGLDTFSIPTNQPLVRRDLEDLVFQTEHGKFLAIAKQIKDLNDKGQPVLIGTVSIEKNELLAEYLKKSGITCKILNAKNHEEEGQIIANAGKAGAVTVATNMAGRGVDIKLGGATPTPAEYQEVKNLGGLFVIGTERHEARRIDDQLRGRSGRQGDPGASQFFLSLEDSLMRIFAPDRIKAMMGRFGIAEDEPIKNRFITKAIANAQSKIEGLNFDMRKHLLEYDDVINHQRVTMYDRRQAVLFGGEPEAREFLSRAISALVLPAAEATKFWELFETRKKELGPDAFISGIRQIILQVIDMYWVEHLEAIDYMKGSVRLRAYGQRDPLVEFKKEGLRLFKDMELAIFDQIIKAVPNIGAAVKTEEQKLREVHRRAQIVGGGNGSGLIDKETIATIRSTLAQTGAGADVSQFGKVGSPVETQRVKVGRNDPCPCGSGKKFKKCHGQ